MGKISGKSRRGIVSARKHDLSSLFSFLLFVAWSVVVRLEL